MKKPLVATFFVFSVVGAGAAAIHIFAPKVDATTPKEQILAATMPLPGGTLLRAQDVTWQGVSRTEPGEVVHPSAAALATKPELEEQARTSVYGAVLRHALAAGEPIRLGDIVKPGDRDFLQVVLTPGSRAIAIPVATGGASTGLLSPGDRVNVILTQNFKNDNNQDLKNTPVTRRSVGETIVEDLRVLAIDALDTRPNAPLANATNGNFGRTVTLEVTDDQAEKINVATELGKLSLTLRGVGQPVTTLASALPSAPPTPVLSNQTDPIKPQWAGDVSPALYGAAQEKPAVLAPPPVVVFHGAPCRQENDCSGDKSRQVVKLD
jgi:pilus assembly protein CpaB